MQSAAAAGSSNPATLGSLTSELYDAVGKTNLQWRKTATELINEWLQKLVNMHQWSWRLEYATLDVTQDVSYVALPANFSQLLWCKATGSSDYARPLAWSQIMERRATQIMVSGPGEICYAVRWIEQASASSAPTARIELWPTPAATEADRLAMAYKRLIPALSDADHIPDVPIWMHPLIRQFVRAEAQAYDDQAEPAARSQLEFDRMLPDYLAIDGQLQDGGGPILGATMTDYAGGVRRPHTEIGFA
jgi:hypothetical protein